MYTIIKNDQYASWYRRESQGLYYDSNSTWYQPEATSNDIRETLRLAADNANEPF